ncbi:[protein-PII] uridylyltransferase [Neisseria sp. ZJ106]|uniref:Bifunctional uridylyltransferase/uridylyl-removing enzyme n=1 Tax=Neisseria lisongii TaxID=2912188 RepID=A0ABY7RKS7_9NEIS|nr:[protein-PII] uridylyltransferase [Neisseria lisongii]MCF7521299.1 [protein-PII] uridylyltransferase [Neisseria lisongii]WCL72103.1 [protein-PII] uridylyltransferase [Neisseria lisongii]
MQEQILAAQRRFAAERQEAEALFLKRKQPAVFFKRYARAAEQLLAALWEVYFSDRKLCLLATGGFGRGELYPYSDLDLALVSPATLDEDDQQQIAAFVQTLWDMKLIPSLKSGSVAELCGSVKDDISGDTAFLEARLLAGDAALAAALSAKISAQRDVATFTEAKILEMQQRQAKSQGSGTLLEPNIKSGSGGLRDLHTMLWIAKAQGLDTRFPSLIRHGILTSAEAGMLAESYKQLAAIRIHLHLCAKRAEDRLIFDLQGQVAESMGWQDDSRQRKSEKLMRLFYRTVKTIKQLHGILLPVLQERIDTNPYPITLRIDDDYIQVNHQIAARNPDIFLNNPEHIFKIVSIWQSRNDITSLEPKTLRAWWGASRKIKRSFYQNPANRRRFVEFFRNGNGLTHVLRFLNLYGVLGCYLPAWEKIVGLLQHDLFHIYPVDDHILTVVHNMRRLALDKHTHEHPFASSLMQGFEHKAVLYMAAFFHDIAKGRGGDHAVLGVDDARAFSDGHGLSSHEADLLAWLVEEHLLMSAVAQKEDIQNPEVIRAFCRKVKTYERLTALYLLTVADIRGTNPKLWNTWRASLLENLFHAAVYHLSSNGNTPNLLYNRRQQRAADFLTRSGAPEKQQKKLFQMLGSDYFASHQTREILWHSTNLVYDFETPRIRSRILPKSNSFQVMIFMPNGPRLFARLCRIFSRHGFDILAARAFVTAHNYILDTFIVQIPEQHDPEDYPNIQSALEAELNSFIHGYDLSEQQYHTGRISRRSRYMPIAPGVMIAQEEDFPGWYTIDIVAVNRPLLLADIAEVFFAHDVRIRYAKIATLDERIEDSFRVFSEQLADPKKQSALKQALLAQLAV